MHVCIYVRMFMYVYISAYVFIMCVCTYLRMNAYIYMPEFGFTV